MAILLLDIRMSEARGGSPELMQRINDWFDKGEPRAGYRFVGSVEGGPPELYEYLTGNSC